MPNPKNFNINGHLLTNHAEDWRWNNLGYWAKATDYGQACQELALLHAQAVNLQSGQDVLELACGYGAAFELWQRQFKVNKIDALEYRPQCVVDIKQQAWPSVNQVVEGRFDSPLKAPLNNQQYDVVLCVDAAYHAQSLNQFLAVLSSALKPLGHFAFSTLMLADDYAQYSLGQRAFAQSLLRMAHVSQTSVLSAEQVSNLAQQQHLTNLLIKPLNQHVFLGFANWIENRAALLSLKDKLTADWQKISLTAQWCRWLANNPLLEYVLISGQKAPSPCERE